MQFVVTVGLSKIESFQFIQDAETLQNRDHKASPPIVPGKAVTGNLGTRTHFSGNRVYQDLWKKALSGLEAS
jgi:hypothetical protein